MSLLYAQAVRNVSREAPDAAKFLAILAALVPADILLAHGLILSLTTEKAANGSVEINHPEVLSPLGFWCLVGLSLVAFVCCHGGWDWRDAGRIFISPLAFVGWTMLQRPSSFDAAASPQLWLAQWPQRYGAAIILALLLLYVAKALDFKPKNQRDPMNGPTI